MNTRLSPFEKIVAAILILVAPISLRAQIHAVSSTLDLDVARADQVVVGRIVEVGEATPTTGPDYRQPIVLAVEQTLKGEAVQQLPIVLTTSPFWTQKSPAKLPLSSTDDSVVRSHRLLVAVEKKRPDSPYEIVHTIDLDAVGLSVLTADLVFLTKPADVIQAAKDEVRRSPMKLSDNEYFMWPLPHDNDALKGTIGEHWDVYVPIDERIEKRAYSLLRDPKNTFHDGWTPHSLATDALRFFKSEENILLLKGLLSDPDERTRREAYKVLKGWGVDAPTPPSPGSKLAFLDADHFYAIERSRAILYVSGATIIQQPTAADFNTMLVGHVVSLEFDAEFRAISSDGRKAILATGICGNEAKLVFLDMATGQRQEVPSSWYDSTGSETLAALSADGRLLSIYSETGPADSPMAVSVYDWPTKTLIAKRTSAWISAGGGFGGGVTTDGQAEFVNGRVGSKLVDLTSGRLLGWFGSDSVRSPDGKWVVEFPDLSHNESAPRETILKDGTNAQPRGKLNLDEPVADDEIYGSISGAFCGTTDRFVVARGRSVALYTIPTGNLLTSFSVSSWRDPKVDDTNHPTVACSPTGTRVAILSGSRLTFHDLK